MKSYESKHQVLDFLDNLLLHNVVKDCGHVTVEYATSPFIDPYFYISCTEKAFIAGGYKRSESPRCHPECKLFTPKKEFDEAQRIKKENEEFRNKWLGRGKMVLSVVPFLLNWYGKLPAVTQIALIVAPLAFVAYIYFPGIFYEAVETYKSLKK